MKETVVHLITWVRAHAYCSHSGESMDTISDRINTGVWAEGKHYKRTGPRTLWINIPEVTKWIEAQPNVAPAVSPTASKSARARVANG